MRDWQVDNFIDYCNDVTYSHHCIIVVAAVLVHLKWITSYPVSFLSAENSTTLCSYRGSSLCCEVSHWEESSCWLQGHQQCMIYPTGNICTTALANQHWKESSTVHQIYHMAGYFHWRKLTQISLPICKILSYKNPQNWLQTMTHCSDQYIWSLLH